jgi:hypothetical protein
MRRAGIACSLVAVLGGLAAAQATDLTGTWKLNREASKTNGAGLAGLGGNSGTPSTLYVTQAANGVITMGSDINESQSRMYRPGQASAIPAAQGGTITVTSRWVGRTLAVEGLAGSGITLKEQFSLSEDGRTLTVSIASIAAGSEATSVLVYSKAQAEPPCTSWPTPCRRR